MELIDLLTDDSFFNSVKFKLSVEPCLNDYRFNSNSTVNMLTYKEQAKHNLPNFNESQANNINYVLNNYCHRSEDFVKLDNNKTNILFAGCSITFGEGLPDYHNWPYYITKHFQDNGIDLGQKSILSFLGGTTQTIVSNIFKYVFQFGKPDYIYVILPDMMRTYSYSADLKMFQTHISDSSLLMLKDIPSSEIDIFYKQATEYINWYIALHVFCITNNIKLISTTWSESAGVLLNQLGLESFIFESYSNMQNFIEKENYDLSFLNKIKKDFLFDAADGAHPGVLYNIYFAEKLLRHTAKNYGVVE